MVVVHYAGVSCIMYYLCFVSIWHMYAQNGNKDSCDMTQAAQQLTIHHPRQTMSSIGELTMDET